MMNPLIIKLGGVLLDSEEALERLFSALVNYRESHQRQLVIVHGGGCVVDELMKGLNLPVKKKNGLRVTPADQIDIITEQGIITDGMIVKVNAALDAARTLGRPVDIASWRHAEQLPALFNGMPMGTRILA